MNENQDARTVQADVIHKFERAGLGKAPFRYVGYEFKTYQACHGAPVQVGGSCDYCGVGICNMFYIESADGKRFKVGSNCVEKTGDAGLVRPILQKAKSVKLAAKHEKERIARLWARETLPTVKEKLQAKPHPMNWSGKTLYDWAEWMLKNAGARGEKEVIKAIKAAQEAK